MEEHEIVEEDAKEITRIFDILTDHRKTEVLNNWSNIANKIKESRKWLEKEKEILLIRTLDEIDQEIKEYNKNITNNVI